MSETAPETGDAQAEQQMLAEAVASVDSASSPERPASAAGSDGFPLNTPVADMAPEQQAAYWRHHAQKHEKRTKQYGQYTPEQVKAMATRLTEIEDSQKTEQQRLQEQATAAERRAEQLQAANARLLAAATYGIPADLIDLLGEGDEEQIGERARLLAEKLAAVTPASTPAPPAPPASNRPVESLKPGAAPSASEPDPDAWLRRLAGRTP
ncbi:hypothetical protein [Nonomuraea sp. GTA35]|uniref:hypothetical protein n=1 Tax=Nonomuraea sp. GTA35 TaxID=1676746 RepID=UPI0035BF2355